MKNTDNQTLLAHKRRVDAERRAAAIEAKRKRNLAAMRAVGGAR